MPCSNKHAEIGLYDRDNREFMCRICMEYFSLVEEMKEVQCGHHFHQACIEQWTEKSRESVRHICPVCTNETIQMSCDKESMLFSESFCSPIEEKFKLMTKFIDKAERNHQGCTSLNISRPTEVLLTSENLPEILISNKSHEHQPVKVIPESAFYNLGRYLISQHKNREQQNIPVAASYSTNLLSNDHCYKVNVLEKKDSPGSSATFRRNAKLGKIIPKYQRQKNMQDSNTNIKAHKITSQ